MASSTPTPTARHSGPVVGLLTLLWVGGLLALIYRWFAIGMERWGTSSSSPSSEMEYLGRQMSQAVMAALLLAATGPAVIAAVAYGMRLARTAIVFLVLAVVLGVPALTLAAHAYRDLNPPPPPPAPVPGCHEHSGGDTRCPGG
ncbi:DUF6234 family protein [Micromonospora sp. NPDC001898]|uniref:DUF6234 family protein n=1 Tax=Micromonospora sp. NPDC001898 TaxID=3364221 RepID=UPI003694F5CF